jgi:hypothetical protein
MLRGFRRRVISPEIENVDARGLITLRIDDFRGIWMASGDYQQR